MIPQIWLDSVTFSDGTTISLDANDIIIIVGPKFLCFIFHRLFLLFSVSISFIYPYIIRIIHYVKINYKPAPLSQNLINTYTAAYRPRHFVNLKTG